MKLTVRQIEVLTEVLEGKKPSFANNREMLARARTFNQLQSGALNYIHWGALTAKGISALRPFYKGHVDLDQAQFAAQEKSDAFDRERAVKVL